jgi:hypothetical protein
MLPFRVRLQILSLARIVAVIPPIFLFFLLILFFISSFTSPLIAAFRKE